MLRRDKIDSCTILYSHVDWVLSRWAFACVTHRIVTSVAAKVATCHNESMRPTLYRTRHLGFIILFVPWRNPPQFDLVITHKTTMFVRVPSVCHGMSWYASDLRLSCTAVDHTPWMIPNRAAYATDAPTGSLAHAYSTELYNGVHSHTMLMSLQHINCGSLERSRRHSHLKESGTCWRHQARPWVGECGVTAAACQGRGGRPCKKSS